MSCDVYPDKKSVAKQPKLCPFRKRTVYKASNANSELSEDKFLSCVEEECAVWNKYYEQCGLTNKFN